MGLNSYMPLGGRVLLALVFVMALLVTSLPSDALDCWKDGNGGGRGVGCDIVDRPDYDPPDDGPSKAEAGGGRTMEQIYNEYCSQYHMEYQDEYIVHFFSHELIDIEIEYYNLDPAGRYESVRAVCERVASDGSHHDLTGPPGYFQPLVISWINVIQEPPDPEEIEFGIRGAIEARVEAIPVDPGEMAPPIDAGVVNTPTWFWVDNDWDVEEAEESWGATTVWAGAEPVKSVYRMDGEVIAECEGPGTPYEGGPLSTGSDCTGEFEEAALEGREGTVEIVWEFVWGESIGGEEFFYGPLGDPYTTSTEVTWTVDEVFSTETG